MGGGNTNTSLFGFDNLFLTQDLPDIAYILCNENSVGDDDADDEFERVGLPTS